MSYSFEHRFTHALLMAVIIHLWATDARVGEWGKLIGPLIIMVAFAWAYVGVRAASQTNK